MLLISKPTQCVEPSIEASIAPAYSISAGEGSVTQIEGLSGGRLGIGMTQPRIARAGSPWPHYRSLVGAVARVRLARIGVEPPSAGSVARFPLTKL